MAFFYLSQVLGRPVTNERGERVAKVKDVVARLEALNASTGEVTMERFPPISGLVVDTGKQEIYVPWSKVESLGPAGAILSSSDLFLESFARREGEVLLYRDMLDKHIIDDLSYTQGAEIIESLDDETAADTLQELDEDRQTDIVETMDQERAADI